MEGRVNVCYTESEDLGQQHPSSSLRLESLATHDDNKIKSHNVNFSSDALEKHRDPGGLTGDTTPIKNECQHSLWVDDCERLVRLVCRSSFSRHSRAIFPEDVVSEVSCRVYHSLHVHSCFLQLNDILTFIAGPRDVRMPPLQEPNNLSQGHGSLTAQEKQSRRLWSLSRTSFLPSHAASRDCHQSFVSDILSVHMLCLQRLAIMLPTVCFSALPCPNHIRNAEVSCHPSTK